MQSYNIHKLQSFTYKSVQNMTKTKLVKKNIRNGRYRCNKSYKLDFFTMNALSQALCAICIVTEKCLQMPDTGRNERLNEYILLRFSQTKSNILRYTFKSDKFYVSMSPEVIPAGNDARRKQFKKHSLNYSFNHQLSASESHSVEIRPTVLNKEDNISKKFFYGVIG